MELKEKYFFAVRSTDLQKKSTWLILLNYL